MKNKQNFHLLALLILSLFLYSSCEQQELLEEEQPEFQELKKTLLEDEDFQILINNQNLFFKKIENKTYDIFEIHSKLGGFDNINFCNIQTNNNYQLNDEILLFSDFVCRSQILLKKIIAKHPNYLKIPLASQIALGKSITGPSAETRAINCLDRFQARWRMAESAQPSYDPGGNLDGLQNPHYSYAVNTYNRCCENGGDGCPP